MTLTPKQHRLFLAHGQTLLDYPVNLSRLGKRLGVSRDTLRVIRTYVQRHGAPTAEDHPGATHIVIGDAHSGPGQDHWRWRALGKEIEAEGREAMSRGTRLEIIQIGDLFDLHSLSSYDVGKAASWNSTYAKDLAAVKTALGILKANVSKEVWDYANWHWTKGNHEHREDRYMQDNPSLQGTLNGPWEILTEVGFNCYGFKEVLSLDGVAYVHYLQNTGNSSAVGGVNHARSLILKGYASITVGHSHKLDVFDDRDVHGNVMRALVVGCFFDHDEAYAGRSNQVWWRGYHICRSVKKGNYDLQSISLETLRRKYPEA